MPVQTGEPFFSSSFAYICGHGTFGRHSCLACSSAREVQQLVATMYSISNTGTPQNIVLQCTCTHGLCTCIHGRTSTWSLLCIRVQEKTSIRHPSLCTFAHDSNIWSLIMTFVEIFFACDCGCRTFVRQLLAILAVLVGLFCARICERRTFVQHLAIALSLAGTSDNDMAAPSATQMPCSPMSR